MEEEKFFDQLAKRRPKQDQPSIYSETSSEFKSIIDEAI